MKLASSTRGAHLMNTRYILVLADLLIVICSFALSALLSVGWAEFPWMILPAALLIRVLFFRWFGLYRAILRYASIHLAVSIVKTTVLSSLVLMAVFRMGVFGHLPVVFFVIDFLMTTFLVGASRFLPRYLIETRRYSGRKRVLVYGAGTLGEEVARKILNRKGEHRLVGFIDDCEAKMGRRIHNLPVMGPIDQLRKFVTRHRAHEVVIAISGIRGEEVRKVTRECHQLNVACRIVPDIVDILHNKEVTIKDVDIADLLKREPRDLDINQIGRFLKDKVILITGAAGSIGSELVFQSLKFKPKKLILMDQSEYGLYQLREEIESRETSLSSSDSLRFVLMDLTEKVDVFHLIEKERPQIIFHAAAYKHVPMLQDNPCAAVRNNVGGTVNVSEAAHTFGVEKFVLISTDKAVRPTSVMGATKRICELYIQNLNLRSQTELVSVRFGNVLGSSGSVIPKFIRQINDGGAVTVTHPNVSRYFMLTQEAVLLVMQAASIGNGGEIFILNMGQPVKISEMAEDLIYLSGKRPYHDVRIVFTGLRPGEKLHEELLIDEMEKKTQYENITIGKTTVIDWNLLNSQISQLLRHAGQWDRAGIYGTIRSIIPEFVFAESATKREEGQSTLIPFPSVAR